MIVDEGRKLLQPVLPEPGASAGVLGGALMDSVEAGGKALEVADPVIAVHELRKAGKRLRALLRLVRGPGRSKAKTLRSQLAAAARALSGARDATVRRQSLDMLVKKQLLDPVSRQAAEAGANLSSEVDTEASLSTVSAPGSEGGGAEGLSLADRAAIAALLKRAGMLVRDLARDTDDRKLIRAIGADYARARRFGRGVDAEDDGAMHELRKRVIVHRYQMELLRPGWPEMVDVWVGELQRLREKLGDYHDLAVLVASLGEMEDAPAWKQDVLRAAQQRRKKLAGSAMRLQARLFAERPVDFRRRVAAYMDTVRPAT